MTGVLLARVTSYTEPVTSAGPPSACAEAATQHRTCRDKCVLGPGLHFPRPRSVRRSPRALAAIIFLDTLKLATASCGRYSANDLELATATRAKEICSCVYVSGQSPEFCDELTAVDPPLVTFRIDQDNRVVEAQALLMWSARARFVDKQSGCALE